jgi:hypothetical protein
MDPGKCFNILLALACIAMFAAGCTSSKPTTTTPVAQAPAAIGSAAPAAPAATTPECPDKYEKGIWNGNWDTRWVSESHDIAPDPNYPGYPWSGQDSPGATPVQLTQKCRDVTGTYIPGGAAMGSGSITAKIEGNQLIGTYKTVWTSGSSNDEYGTFTLTMAADNQSWVGYAKSHDRGDYNDPDNWVGRR